MSGEPLGFECAPVQDVYRVGGPIPIRLTISNRSGAEVEIPAVGLPWHSFYAITFQVKNRRGFRRALPEAPPLELPAVRIPAAGSIQGEVDLGAYLLWEDGESIRNKAGEYEVEGTLLSFVRVSGGEQREVKLRCGPFRVHIQA